MALFGISRTSLRPGELLHAHFVPCIVECRSRQRHLLVHRRVDQLVPRLGPASRPAWPSRILFLAALVSKCWFLMDDAAMRRLQATSSARPPAMITNWSRVLGFLGVILWSAG